VPVTKEGIVPGYYYVVRKKGEVELGLFSCATCHSRVLPDGTLVSGAQGNFPVESAYGYALRKNPLKKPEARLEAGLNFNPSERKRLTDGLYDRPTEEIAAVHEAMIPGIAMRSGFSYLDPPKIADLIGLKDRKYLDMTARLQHRSIGDVMRYGTMFGGINYFFSATRQVREQDLTDPKKLFRYTDEQAYAYSLYVYSLRPPPNPNRPSALTEQGRKVFTEQGCPACHTPPLYTNNKLTLAGGFTSPLDHTKRYDVLPVRVGTDGRSAFESLRGRGYYKVPSLKGVWYRGPFEHNGSIATLEDWFDPARLREDYVPTGFKGYGVKARAVPGHQFGLGLNATDKAALIAFLKTL
jgi:mono/diheme cytochrome c family protein